MGSFVSFHYSYHKSLKLFFVADTYRMKKQKRHKSKEANDHGGDTTEKSLKMIIRDSKIKADAYRKILESFKISEKNNNL